MTEALDLIPDALARDVIVHLCGEECHGFGQTTEMCESRGDCVVLVTCGCCHKVFTLDDDQYELLVAWSATQGATLACGIEPLTS